VKEKPGMRSFGGNPLRKDAQPPEVARSSRGLCRKNGKGVRYHPVTALFNSCRALFPNLKPYKKVDHKYDRKTGQEREQIHKFELHEYKKDYEDSMVLSLHNKRNRL
jgi:hypothetical protein